MENEGFRDVTGASFQGKNVNIELDSARRAVVLCSRRTRANMENVAVKREIATEKATWNSPELQELDVSETLGGVVIELPEGQFVTTTDGQVLEGIS